jgi:hypothetical protein
MPSLRRRGVPDCRACPVTRDDGVPRSFGLTQAQVDLIAASIAAGALND